MRAGENFCPGVLHAVPAKDGLLIRVRVPGGLIEANQLSTIAELSSGFADGTIEITSRANLQLRGIRTEDLSRIVDSISSAGLLPSPLHDRVRNIITSPVAGLDPGELIDPRPLIRQLDRPLQADTAFVSLHSKFSFAIHGGPKRFSRDTDDVSLDALNLGAAPYFRFSLGGVSSGFVVKPRDAVDCMVITARMCIELANEFSLPVRGKAVVAVPGAMQRILDALSPMLQPSPPLLPASAVDEALPGIFPTPQDDRVSIIPSVPLGRLNPEQARYLAD